MVEQTAKLECKMAEQTAKLEEVITKFQKNTWKVASNKFKPDENLYSYLINLNMTGLKMNRDEDLGLSKWNRDVCEYWIYTIKWNVRLMWYSR